jgi:hypothetical protein
MTKPLFKTLLPLTMVALLGAALAAPVYADDWRDRDRDRWEDHEHHERAWREHEMHEREWREHEWREHHYDAPPVYYAPQPGYAVVPPPVVMSVPSGINIVVPLRIR